MNPMRPFHSLRVIIALSALAVAPSIRAEQGSLTFVFGPSSQEAERQAVRAAAATARHWLQTAGNSVEVRRAGSPGVQQIQAAMSGKDIEKALGDMALAAREADPPSFVIALDSAAQTAALQPGARIVVAVLNSPPFSSEGERALEHVTEICNEKGVRILVLDIAENAKLTPSPVLKNLVTKTGGSWLRQAKGLEGEVNMAAPAQDQDAEAAPVPSVSAANQTQTPPQTPGAIPNFEIPVHIRFMRTSGTGSVGSSMLDHETDFGETFTLNATSGAPGGSLAIVGGGGSMERSYEANDSHAPLQGLVAVEAPLSGLKFDIDDNTNTFQARARITATVRNPKGAAIWTGRRDVNVHGPKEKLETRREGSMFFMRGVSLAGGGPFTLEAKIEDLIAGNAGVVKTPLKTSRNAPGLVATDALVVRPFNGAADKFEADEVLSYEGEALSPVLNPVFRTEQPLNLQIYLRLYPDIHGSPVEIGMDVLTGGRVVAHIPLPFKQGLANSALEGSEANMYGAQVKEFPYLADLKGAKFPPGDYRGVISIRQGKNVIKRVVAFQVIGKPSATPVQVAAAFKSGPAPAADENVDVVLPEIEPATVDASGLKMRPEEQKKLWDEAAKTAMGYLDHLPNFRCLQETHRFTAPLKTPNQLKQIDSYLDALTYEDGKEVDQRLEVNGVKVENLPVGDNDKGVRARNEFWRMLSGVFDPEVGAKYKWSGHALATGVLCQVFEVEVSKEKSNFVLNHGGRRLQVAYTGRAFIDAETGMVRKLTIQGVGLDKDFGLQSPALSLDYGTVKIGKDDYLLPLRSVLQLRHAKAFVRNETVFRSYRKFQAESEIKFQND